MSNLLHVLLPFTIVTLLVLLQYSRLFASLNLSSLSEPLTGHLVMMADDANAKETMASHLHALVDMGRYVIA